MTTTTLVKRNIPTFDSVIYLIQKMKESNLELISPNKEPKSSSLFHTDIDEMIICDEGNVLLNMDGEEVILPALANLEIKVKNKQKAPQ
ncbi:hypothetical protein Q7A53_06010 [Halobacillus rhizosphaerae]|uniref:hypothetical protein n=1 Tax=Halobacillus rhizosphaerae TaxID=3064889 RepID=UPI00398B561A